MHRWRFENSWEAGYALAQRQTDRMQPSLSTLPGPCLGTPVGLARHQSNDTGDVFPSTCGSENKGILMSPRSTIQLGHKL